MLLLDTIREDLKTSIQLGQQMVKLVVNGHSVKLGLGYDCVYSSFVGADTDRENFSSDVKNHEEGSSSSDEGTFLVALLHDDPLKPDLPVIQFLGDYENPVDLPDLIEEEPDSDTGTEDASVL